MPHSSIPRTSRQRRLVRFLPVIILLSLTIGLFIWAFRVPGAPQVSHVLTVSSEQLTSDIDSSGRPILTVPVDGGRHTARLATNANLRPGTTLLYWERFDTHEVAQERFESSLTSLLNLAALSTLCLTIAATFLLAKRPRSRR